jgi:signal transduction histidine kinase
LVILIGGKRPFIFVAVAIVITYGVFFYLQALNDKNLSASLLQEHKERQELLAASVTQNIGSDLDSALQRIKALALIPSFKVGNSNYSLSNQMEQVFMDIRDIAPFDELFIVYTNGSGIKIYEKPAIHLTVNSTDTPYYSINSFIKQSLNEKRSLFSSGYNSDGKWRIAITTPIFNRDTGTYIGLIGISIPSLDLVNRYGNVLDATKQRLVFYDKNATLLAGYPMPNSLIGHSMFSPENQRILSDNGRPMVNQLFRKALSGEVFTSEFDLGDGMRIVTGYPIYAEGKPVYYLNVPTPFSQILSPIQYLLQTEFFLNIILLGAFTAAVIYLVWILSRWGNTMDNEVKKRTHELENAIKLLQSTNKELNQANIELELQDKLQREFVNVAAHELRTPTQAIIGYAEMINISQDKNAEYEQMLLRNANRLHRLSSDILDVARIDSGTLKLDKSDFDINVKISNVISDVSEASKSEIKIKNLKIIFQPKEPIIVQADKSRIFQVISNLLNNAIKFSKGGTITVTDDSNNNHEVIITIVDTGMGISDEIKPKLFERFSHKSESGTGLGLFIAKSIVEAHGGSISAYNNPSGIGATFSFTLPLIKKTERDS